MQLKPYRWFMSEGQRTQADLWHIVAWDLSLIYVAPGFGRPQRAADALTYCIRLEDTAQATPPYRAKLRREAAQIMRAHLCQIVDLALVELWARKRTDRLIVIQSLGVGDIEEAANFTTWAETVIDEFCSRMENQANAATE